MTKENTLQPYLFVKQLILTLPLLGLFLLAASNVSGQITSDATSCSASNGMPTLMPAGIVNGKPSYSCTACTGNGNCDILVSWSGTLWEYDVTCGGGAFPGTVATNTADTNEPPCGADFPWMDTLLGCIDGNVLIGGADCTSFCPKITPAITDQVICTGSEPDFATAESEIAINAVASSIGAFTYFLDAGFTMAYTAGSAVNNTCEPITVTLYGRLQCADTNFAGTADEFDDFMFDVLVYPNFTNVVVDDGTTCGTPTVQQVAADGSTVCDTFTATCASSGDTFTTAFTAPANAPADCSTIEQVTVTCSGCGCTDPTACNYDPTAVSDDGSCILPDGCTDPEASNYDPAATCNDGSCIFIDPSFDCPPTQTSCNGDPFNLNPVEPGGTWGGTAGSFVMNDVLDPTGMPTGSYTLTYTVNGVTSEVCEFAVVLPPKSANAGSLNN